MSDMSPADRRTARLVLALTQAGTLRGGEELYSYDVPGVGRVTWNVTQAQALLAAGRAEGWDEVPRAHLAHIAATYDYDHVHVSDVDPDAPGITAAILDGGQRRYVLVDGTHRAVRAYHEGRAFVVLVLSDADSRRCVLEAPPGVIP